MGRTSHTTFASQCAAVVAALIGTVALTVMALSGHPFHAGAIQAVAAARDDRTFYYVTDQGTAEQIMRFRLTAAGTITGLAKVRGGALNPKAVADSLAVSPDGAKLGPHHGWIHGGALHLLPPTNGDGEPMAW